MGIRSFFLSMLGCTQHSIGLDRSWSAGDMAECIGEGSWISNGTFQQMPPGPVKGEIRVVIDVVLVPFNGEDFIVLCFTRFPGRRFDSRSFRKIVPHADRAECADAAFLSTLKPVRVLEPTSGAPC